MRNVGVVFWQSSIKERHCTGVREVPGLGFICSDAAQVPKLAREGEGGMALTACPCAEAEGPSSPLPCTCISGAMRAVSVVVHKAIP